VCTHVLAQTYTDVHAQTYTGVRTLTRTYTRKRTHVYTHKHTHTYTHLHTHTHTRAHTHTASSTVPCTETRKAGCCKCWSCPSRLCGASCRDLVTAVPASGVAAMMVIGNKVCESGPRPVSHNRARMCAHAVIATAYLQMPHRAGSGTPATRSRWGRAETECAASR
jgi:hypothetical protein